MSVLLCVALLMCLFVLCVACLTVFVNCLVKQFAMCVGVVAILLLNVMDVFSVCGGALLDRPCMVFQRALDHTFRAHYSNHLYHYHKGYVPC